MPKMACCGCIEVQGNLGFFFLILAGTILKLSCDLLWLMDVLDSRIADTVCFNVLHSI
jgi:hypothetical protein